MKIRPVGAKLFPKEKQRDSQIDMTKLVVAFGNFAYALNKWTTQMTRFQQNGAISRTARSLILQCSFIFRSDCLLLWRCCATDYFIGVCNKNRV